MSNGKKWICNFTEKILYLEKLKKKQTEFFPVKSISEPFSFFISDSICDLNKISPNLILVIRSHKIFKRSHYFREIDFTKKKYYLYNTVIN